jgi:hypothetical protein
VTFVAPYMTGSTGGNLRAGAVRAWGFARLFRSISLFPAPLPPPKKRASIPSIPQKGIDESGGFRFFSVKFQMVELFSGIDGIDGTEFRKVSILHEGCGSEVGLSRRFDFSIPSIP